MSSEKRINASRENGKKGGPRSTEGKERSSRNSTKHGLYSQRCPVLSLEDAGLFEQLRNRYFHTYKPVGAAEVDLVESLVLYTWRIRRFCSCQGWFLEKELAEQAPALAQTCPGLPHPARLTFAVQELFHSEPGFDALSRFEARLERVRDRLLRALERTQRNRLLLSGAKLKNSQNEPSSPVESTPDSAEPAPSAPENWSDLAFESFAPFRTRHEQAIPPAEAPVSPALKANAA